MAVVVSDLKQKRACPRLITIPCGHAMNHDGNISQTMARNQEKKRTHDVVPAGALNTIFFLTGVCAIATQMYCVRELLVVFFGNELFLGILFGCWFVGISTGSWFATRIARRTSYRPAALAGGLIVLGLLPLGALVVARLLRFVVPIPVGGCASLAHMTAGSLLVAFPPGCAVGFLFPVACSVLQNDGVRAGRGIARVYMWESLGSLGAGIIVSFFVVSAFPAMLVLGWIAALLFAATGLYALRGEALDRRLRMLGVAAMLLAAGDACMLGTGAWQRLDEFFRELHWQSLKNGLRRIAEVDSRYQRITLGEAGGQYSVFLNGMLWCVYPDPYRTALKSHLLLSQHPAPEHVLILGNAGAGMLSEVLHHPVRAIDCVSLDPAIDRMLLPLLMPEDRRAMEDPRVAFHYQDARLFVKHARRMYELVIVDVPDPLTAFLNRLYTVDFFKELRNILSPNGMVVIGLSYEQQYITTASALYNGSLYRGLMQVFPSVLVVPGERNYFFAAVHEGLVSDDPERPAQRYRDRNIMTEHFSPSLFPHLMPRERILFLQQALATGGRSAQLNTDLYPVTYFYNLVIWDAVAGGSGVPHLLLKIREHTGTVLGGGGAVAVICLLLALRFGSQVLLPGATAFLIAASGGVVMALEIVIVYLVQSLHGYVYEKIGAIVALCMVGLACGAALARKLLRFYGETESGIFRLMFTLAVLLLIVTGITPFLVNTTVAGHAYWPLIFLLGLLGGAQFPCGCQMLACRGGQVASVAGCMNAADHAGACCGAVLTGTALMPLFGIRTTCLILCGVLLWGIVLLGWSINRGR